MSYSSRFSYNFLKIFLISLVLVYKGAFYSDFSHVCIIFFNGNSKSIFIMNLNIYLFLVALGYWSDMQYHLSPFHDFLCFFLNFLRMQFLSVLKFHIVAESSLLQIFIRISFCSFDTVQLLDSIFGSSLITVLQSQQFPLQCSWACLWFFPMMSSTRSSKHCSTSLW